MNKNSLSQCTDIQSYNFDARIVFASMILHPVGGESPSCACKGINSCLRRNGTGLGGFLGPLQGTLISIRIPFISERVFFFYVEHAPICAEQMLRNSRKTNGANRNRTEQGERIAARTVRTHKQHSTKNGASLSIVIRVYFKCLAHLWREGGRV